jgi:outer membrane lipoprotein LolB
MRSANLQTLFCTIFVISGVIALTLSCSRTYKTAVQNEHVYSNLEVLRAALSKLDLENPKKDLDDNLRLGDVRFKSVCGYVCTSPGVGDEYYYHANYYGTDVIEGTSDAIEGDEHLKLIEKATQYAEEYNRLLIINLNEHR